MPDPNNIERIANSQVQALIGIASFLLLLVIRVVEFFFPLGISLVSMIIISAGSLLLLIEGVYSLRRAMGGGRVWAIIWAISMLIPIAWLAVVFVLNRRATTQLESKNVRVGLLGASIANRNPPTAMLTIIWLIGIAIDIAIRIIA